MSEDIKVCNLHSGFKANIDELCKFKDKMTESETGTVDRIWTAIDTAKTLANSKVGRGLAIVLFVAAVSLIGTLFALIYQSNSTMLVEMGSIKADVAEIVGKLK